METMETRVNLQRWGIAALLFLAVCAVWITGNRRVAAQANEAWAVPVNVSRSGAATEPLLVVDSSGVSHAFWLENEREFAYARAENGVWDESRVIEPSFGTRIYSDLTSNAPTPLFIPKLVADQTGAVFAFWINDDGQMVFSDVAAELIGNGAVLDWRAPVTLSGSAQAVDALVDGENRVHVVYVRTDESADFPAGVYHRASADNGASWSDAQLLYPSRFFRSISPDEMHINTFSSGSTVFAAWDNRPEETVTIVRSGDGGLTWSDPFEVDRRLPEDGIDAIGPADIVGSASGDDVLLVWRANHDNAPECAIYYRTSTDGGDNWSAINNLDSLPGCPGSIQLVSDNNDATILVAPGPNLSYLVGWDGLRWSDAQPEPILTRFNNPTTFREVTLGCAHAVFSQRDELELIGCDVGEGSDIWSLRRTLQDYERWFPSPTDWRRAEPVREGLTGITQADLVTDGDGRLHLAWSNAGDPAVQYSRLEGGSRWTAPIEALRSPEGRADDPSLAVDASGRLLAVWVDEEAGELYFSQANAERAAAQTEWATTRVIAASENVLKSPQLLVSADDELVVMYAAPLNEGRGVYLIRSTDGGETWSAPALVFDAAAADWTMVDDPRLHIAPDGRWHMLWTQYTVPGTGGPIALYYAQSDDGGVTWSPAELVSDAPVLWSAVTTTGEDTVHRVWQSSANDLVTLWHQQSDDGGATWRNPTRVSSFGDAAGATALVRDEIDRLHLMQLQASGLHYWLWDQDVWSGDTNVGIIPLSAENAHLIAALDATGNLAVVFSDRAGEQFEELRQNAFYYTGRALDYPRERPTPVPTSTPTPQPDNEPTPTPTVAPTPTLAFPLDQPATPANSLGQVQGIALGIIAAIFFVGIAFVIGLRVTGARRGS